MKTDEMHPVYYVYKHTFLDGSIYIGKGHGNRANEFMRGRSIAYGDLLKKFGAPEVKMLCEKLIEEEAYKIEAKEITDHRQRGEKVINMSDGLETNDIGTMPPKTLLHSLMHRKIHPKYKQIVHLKSIDREGSYSIGITLANAAIKLGMTCDALIAILNVEKYPTIGGYRFISQQDAIELAPSYAQKIIDATDKAIRELQIADDK